MRLFLVVVALICFGSLNYLSFHPFSHQCSDCFLPYGWPMPFWHDGGFAGGAGWYAGGLVVDILVVVVSVMLILFLGKHRPKAE